MGELVHTEFTVRDARSLLRALADRKDDIKNVIVMIDEGDGEPVFACNEMSVGDAWWLLTQTVIYFLGAYMAPSDE